MARSNLRKFKNPEVLRKINFNRLIAFLKRFMGYLTRQGLKIEDVGEKDFDYEALANILANQMFVGEDDEEFFYAFALIGETSSDSYNEKLRNFIQTRCYSGDLSDSMSTADMAMLVYSNEPEELDNIERDVSTTKKRNLAMYATDRDTSEFLVTDAFLEKFEYFMNQQLTAHNCGSTAYAKIGSGAPDDAVLQVRHGVSYKRQGVVVTGKKSKTIGYQPESYNNLIINMLTGELRICCPMSPKWLEKAYSTSLGMAIFNDPLAFATPRINDLERVKELDRKVTLYRGHGITGIQLVEAYGAALPGCLFKARYTSPSGDLFCDFEKAGRSLSDMGILYELVFAVQRNGVSRRIKVSASNRSGYDYDEFGIAIDDWFRTDGIIRQAKKGEGNLYVASIDSDGEIAAAI